MAKLIVQVQISLDGFICGNNDEMDWIHWNFSTKANQTIETLTEPVQHILLGHKLAQGFIPYWLKMPATAADHGASKKINGCKKIVFTRNKVLAQEPIPENWKGGGQVEMTAVDLKTYVTDLKQNSIAPLIAYGGSEFVKSLLTAELVDDLYLFMQPVALGAGKSIFGQQTKLKLMKADRDENGVVILHYQKAS